MQEFNTNCKALADVAGEYCHVVETIDRLSDNGLERLAALLPRIHAAVLSLSDQTLVTEPLVLNADFDARFALFSRLHKLFGDRDHYRLTYDNGLGLAELSGSLADDITDIYFELKSGLELLEHDPGQPNLAVNRWHSGFLWHWGQHLVDAERHLYEMQVHAICEPRGHSKLTVRGQ